MPRSGIRSVIRCLAALGASLALSALLALPALAEETDPTAKADAARQAAVDNANAARQSALDQASNVVATMPGVGVNAPAVVIDVHPIVVQKDIVVDASLNGTPDTVKQTSSNSATVTQDASAQPGAASASGGGIAISGGAVVGTIAVVTQVNVEVVAGFVPAGGVTQDASNTASVDQSASAVGGDANANGAGSKATAGSANALAVTRVSQFNTLWFVGTNPDAAAPVAQAGTNAASVSQSASATAGGATAGAGAQASGGKATDTSSITVDQVNLVHNW